MSDNEYLGDGPTINPSRIVPYMTAKGEFSIGGELWPGLSKLMEESGEAVEVLPELILLKLLGRLNQVCGKIIGNEGRPDHWDGSNLPTRLTEELGDVLAGIWFVADKNGDIMEAVTERAVAKIKLYEQWHGERLQERNQ